MRPNIPGNPVPSCGAHHLMGHLRDNLAEVLSALVHVPAAGRAIVHQSVSAMAARQRSDGPVQWGNLLESLRGESVPRPILGRKDMLVQSPWSMPIWLEMSRPFQQYAGAPVETNGVRMVARRVSLRGVERYWPIDLGNAPDVLALNRFLFRFPRRAPCSPFLPALLLLLLRQFDFGGRSWRLCFLCYISGLSPL